MHLQPRKRGQEVREGDTDPLLLSGKTTPEVLHPVLGSPTQKILLPQKTISHIKNIVQGFIYMNIKQDQLKLFEFYRVRVLIYLNGDQ